MMKTLRPLFARHPGRLTLAAALALSAATLAIAQPAPAPQGGSQDGSHARSEHRGPGGPHDGMRGGPGGPGGPGMGGMMLHDRQLDGVGATAEQKTKIREIFRAAYADNAKQHETDRDLHRKMAGLMAAPKLDPAAAEAVRQQISAAQDARSKRMLQAMLDAGAVLTPEQRQKLSENMAKRREMRERRAPHDGRG